MGPNVLVVNPIAYEPIAILRYAGVPVLETNEPIARSPIAILSEPDTIDDPEK